MLLPLKLSPKTEPQYFAQMLRNFVHFEQSVACKSVALKNKCVCGFYNGLELV